MGYDIRKNERLRMLTLESSLPLFVRSIGVSYPDSRYRVRRGMSQTTVVEYILEGEGHVLMHGSMHRVKQGQVYILPAGVPHDYYSDPDAPMHKIWINYHGPLPTRLLSDYGIEEWLFDGEELRYIFEQVQAMVFSDMADVDCQRILAGLYMELLVKLHYIRKNAAHAPEAAKMKAYLDANLHRAVGNAELAAHVFRSIDFCTKLFKREYGMTPYDYHLKQRLQMACSLLRQTTMEVAAIAADVGFEDPHYFSRLFKQKYKITPKQYRTGK